MPTFESIQNQGNATFLDTVFETSCLTSGRQLPDLSPRHGSCGVVSPAFPFRGRKDAGTFGDGARPHSASPPVPCAQKCHTCFPHPIKEAAREFNKNTPQTWGMTPRRDRWIFPERNTPTKWGRPPVKPFAPMPMHRTILESELACDLRQTVQHGGALGGLKPRKKLFT